MGIGKGICLHKAAQILDERGRKDEALKLCEAGLKASPNSEKLLYTYGLLLIDGPNNAAALTVFKRLTEMDAQNATYFGYLGNSYLNIGLTDWRSRLMKKRTNWPTENNTGLWATLEICSTIRDCIR